MVLGFDNFKKWFDGYDDQYVIIGGTACDILMSEEGQDFRATKDIDLVLIIENLTVDFGYRFWEYIRKGDYKYKRKSSGEPHFYRFGNPGNSGFPHMIELFSRRVDLICLPADAVISPLPLNDELSSLSAILVDNDYYNFLLAGRSVIDGVPILGAAYLIPFKAKAWLDMTARKATGAAADSRHIRKHKNDVFRLTQLLTAPLKINLPTTIKADLTDFYTAMIQEDVDMKSLGIPYSKDDALKQIQFVYF